MNKDELMDQIDEWYENEEHDKIVSAILALPENELDDDILGQLAVAYNNTGEFKKAIGEVTGKNVIIAANGMNIEFNKEPF